MFLRAVRSEFQKILTVRMWWVLLIVLVGYVAFTSGLLAGVFGGLGDQLASSGGNAPDITDAALPPIIYSIASSIGYVFPVLFGTLATTSEFRHQTLTPTFLAQPHRGTVLGAKLVTLAVFGALYGIAALVASVGLGASILSATGHSTALGDSDTWALLARVVLAMAIWAIIGVGLGALIPSQVAAIVIVLAFTQFLEPILRLMTSLADWAAGIGQYLPGAASDALVGSSIFTSMTAAASGAQSLEWWQGGLVLFGMAIVAAGLGYLTSWRKDVT
ncbi:ABC-2 transporter permease [Terrimesophilobacter mesophilus]|uniref:ABC transporter permease n=1 Tax=Terrimesophilobacter mesophilus TaxID=433647 RepID=A0A4R8VCZ0_9MICO|nr:ABC transporter permease [Terrimesophilobacter mesophilus]TFB80889.1 ABC transporter permease [Terrimesophilobacter mesophilus]